MRADNPAGHTAGSPSDDELLAAVRQGDTAALETLLVRYQPHLCGFGLRMCGNVEDAGDVAQESLISMARSVRDFRGDSSVSSWLFTIARRFCIKKRRRSKFAPREKSRWTPLEPTSPGTLPIRGRTRSRMRPIGNLRPHSRTPSTRWSLLSARSWCCATSKGYRRRKWPRSWA